MSETPPRPVPGSLIPKLPTTLPFEDETARKRRDGCLKWGLVGCGVASVLVIVGLLFVLSNAKKLMGLAFDKMGDQVIAATTPDVSPAEKDQFRAALARFAENAKSGAIQPADVQAWQATVMGALGKGRITPQDLRGLTAWLEVHARPYATSTTPPPKT